MRGLRIVTAESCTGGLVASTCTAIPGSSDWFEGSFVTYRISRQATTCSAWPMQRLQRWGAVSEPTATEMAIGALLRCDAGIAVSVTGVAGPSGGDVSDAGRHRVVRVGHAYPQRHPAWCRPRATFSPGNARTGPPRRGRNRARGRARLSRFARNRFPTLPRRPNHPGRDRRWRRPTHCMATRSSSSTTVVGRVRSTGAAPVRQSSSFTKCPACIRWSIRFADHVAAAGMTAVMPSLFGSPGREVTMGHAVGVMLKAICVRREFNVWATNRSSPIVDWCRALARKMHAECGGNGVGAVGMCFTGNFALAMMTEPSVVAPVLSQPSLPLPAGPGGDKRRGAIGVSDDEIACAKRRFKDENLSMIGLRFFGDSFVPDERFDTLKKTFGDKFEAIELDPKDAAPNTGMAPHSVLTLHLRRRRSDRADQARRAARDRVLQAARRRNLTLLLAARSLCQVASVMQAPSHERPTRRTARRAVRRSRWNRATAANRAGRGCRR